MVFSEQQVSGKSLELPIVSLLYGLSLNTVALSENTAIALYALVFIQLSKHPLNRAFF